jgi:hypothetical protein
MEFPFSAIGSQERGGDHPGNEEKRRYTRRMSTPTQPATDTEELESALRQLLAKERLPDYIQSARYELSTDHYGDPMVRIYLDVTPENALILEKDKAKLSKYSEYKQRLRSQVLKLETDYFPLIRMVETP